MVTVSPKGNLPQPGHDVPSANPLPGQQPNVHTDLATLGTGGGVPKSNQDTQQQDPIRGGK